MVDKYANWVSSGFGKSIAKKLGLPIPVKLKRYSEQKKPLGLEVLFGSFQQGRVAQSIKEILSHLPIVNYITEEGQIYRITEAGKMESKDDQLKFHGLIFDATEVKTLEDLKAVYNFFHPVARRIKSSGRVIILAKDPADCEDAVAAMANRGLVGFIKSLGKEVGQGIAAQIVLVSEGAERNLASTLDFLLSYKSAYVSGQVIRVHKAAAIEYNREQPLQGKLALVTGSARGIGRSIAQVLARDGAKVVVLDIEAQKDALIALAQELGGDYLTADITAEDTPARLAEFGAQHGGWDILIHNAGITKDKMFRNMSEAQWDAVMQVNVMAEQKINTHLLKNNGLNSNSRIIGVSSVAGIAGNAGQTNYATSKAAVIGLVEYAGSRLQDEMTINAVAPGFIETDMTAKIPFMIREVGRRMNAMSQGGLPVDVAETIAWLANPGSNGVNGNIVRVCGLMMLGA